MNESSTERAIQSNSQIYDEWQNFLYETAEKVDEELSERDFFFTAKNFLAAYPLETQFYCWKQAIIESEAEEGFEFDGCLEFPIPASFYSYSQTEIMRLTQIIELEREVKEMRLLNRQENEVDVEKEKKIKGYPPHYLEQIIDTAVRLYEKNDKVRAIDIYSEIEIEKNTYNKRIKFFGYDTPKILDEARARIRDREGNKE